jgi:uncharacterized SAM-binding protein YcdF (DUF218 family)
LYFSPVYTIRLYKMVSFIPDKFRLLVKHLIRISGYVLSIMGALFLLAVILSFTDYPFWAYYWLGTHNARLDNDPQLIVIMGGGGMPSPDGLMRCYYGASIAEEFPDAAIVIAVPEDTSLHRESPEILMAKELVIRGIDSTRIMYERYGRNTRTQALNIMSLLGKTASDTLVLRIVTSPEHMFRSVASFRKVGFAHVGGMSSFEEPIDEQLLVERDVSKRKELMEQRALGLRYNMWNYLKYEITVVREYCAIAYYKLRGWM